VRTTVDVHNFLVERDVPHELVPLRGRVRTPERVAAVLGLDPEQVGRVVLYEGAGGLVAAFVPADQAPDPAKVSAAAQHETLQEVSPARATDLTEFLHEALPPVNLPEGTIAVLDETLAMQEVLYFPGGEATSMLKIRGRDLIAATKARTARLT
jgi:prolyl-tRNA editing enzyme YbaK/EbsC (Cys-tRNA(Pro) deacylase)